MADIDAALVERMVAFVRRMADPMIDTRYNVGVEDAREIVDLLPKPVDPDLIAAREWHAKGKEQVDSPAGAEKFRNGDWDEYEGIQAFLAGAKQARETLAETPLHHG